MYTYADIILILLLLLMIAVSLKSLAYVVRNVNYFLTKRHYLLTSNPTKFFIIIPLLDEAVTVSALIRSLNNLKYPHDRVEIVLATTARERDHTDKNPTHEAILRYIKTKAKEHPTDFNLRVIESSAKTGYVATQNNFAIAALRDEIAKDDFIVFYNADSFPGKNTLLAANTIISEQGEKAKVLQQSSLFTKNLADILKSKQFGAAANAIHQSLWTLKHEVTMTRRQSHLSITTLESANALQRLLFARFTVCVGHGLFVKKSYYDLHPLNEDANIEDTQYGLYQSLEKTPVFTIPVLENSESPSTLRKVIAQKRGWFKLVFDLTALLAQRSASTFTNKHDRVGFVSITIQILGIYMTWFTHSIFIIGTLLWVLISGKVTLILLWLMFYILYWLAPAVFLAFKQKRIVKSKKLAIGNVLLIWILGSHAIMSHSLGPWLAILDKFMGKTSRIKTER